MRSNRRGQQIERGRMATAATALVTTGILAIGILATGLLAGMPGALADFDSPEPGTCRVVEVVETGLSQTQCDALIAFYWATDGPYWSQQMAWNTPSDPCTWGGVVCAPRPGYDVVEQLVLHGNGLGGYIPEQIDGLSALQKLRLSDNQIGGSIPSHLGHLQDVRVLDLSGNRFEGDVPRRLGDLPQLRVLNLSANLLGGALPGELTQLHRLVQFRVERNSCFEAGPYVRAFVAGLVESGDLDNCAAAPVEVSCLAGRGRLDIGLANHGDSDASYAVSVGALAPRLSNVAGRAVGSVTVTGRPEGPLDVRVTRNGELHLAKTVTVDCQADGDAEISGRCTGSSLTDQLLDAELANMGSDAAVYLVMVDGLATRGALVAPGSTARITMAVPVRGALGVVVTRDGQEIYSGTDGFDC